MEVFGIIDDDPTPKIQTGGGTSFTLNSRDYKGMMIVFVSESGLTIGDDSSNGTGINRPKCRNDGRLDIANFDG